jgi:hypothetical protein
MKKAIKQSWRKFKEGRPGHRFHEFYEYMQRKREGRSAAWHVVPIGLGTLLLVGGVAIGWLPGPGGFIAVFGVALLATEFEFLARWLDRAELGVRKAWRVGWKRRSTPARVAELAAAAVVAAGAVYGAALLLLLMR